MNVKTFFAGMVALVLAVSAVTAQCTVATAGGEAAANGYLYSYTVGQVATATALSADATLTEGVQQPATVEVQRIDAVDALPTVSIYPNPTDAVVTLRRTSAPSVATVALYDGTGRLLTEQQWTGEALTLDLTVQPSGVYIVRVNYDTNQVKNYKIIKR